MISKEGIQRKEKEGAARIQKPATYLYSLHVPKEHGRLLRYQNIRRHRHRPGNVLSIHRVGAQCGRAQHLPASCNCGFRDTENDNVLVTGLGLYTFEGSDAWGQSYCYIFEYTTLTSNFSYWVDSRMNAARITTGIAAFMAFCCMVFSWCGFCCGCLSIRPIRIALSVLALIQAALVGCIFLINSSEVCTVSTSCSFSTGGGLAIGALLAYVLASLLFCAARGDDADGEKGGEVLPHATAAAAGPVPGTVTVEKVEHADGTVVMKTTTVNADGSQTVEETTETPVANEEVPMYDAKV